MADKPKTYPEKITELNGQIQLRDDEIAKLNQQLSRLPSMEEELNFLRDKVAGLSKNSGSDNAGTKMQLTDAIQRAETAETQVRNMRQESLADKGLITALHQQLDILGQERDKNLGKDSKIDLLAEQLKSANLQIASFNQYRKDSEREATEHVAQAEKTANYYRSVSDSQAKQLENLKAAIADVPDFVHQLKVLAGLA